MNAIASPLLYQHISVDAMMMLSSLFGDVGRQIFPVHTPERKTEDQTSEADTERSSARLKQLQGILSIQLDMQVYMEEEDDPEDWQPPALRHLERFYSHISADPKLQCAYTLPHLTMMRLGGKRSIWTLDWPRHLLSALARIAPITLVCYSCLDRHSFLEVESFFHNRPISLPRVTLRPHCASFTAVWHLRVPAEIIVDLASPSRVGVYMFGETEAAFRYAFLKPLHTLDHAPRQIGDETHVASLEDVELRSIAVYGLDDHFELHPSPSGPPPMVDVEKMPEWKKDVLDQVQLTVRNMLEQRFFSDWIKADRFSIKVGEEMPACEACGRTKPGQTGSAASQ